MKATGSVGAMMRANFATAAQDETLSRRDKVDAAETAAKHEVAAADNNIKAVEASFKRSFWGKLVGGIAAAVGAISGVFLAVATAGVGAAGALKALGVAAKLAKTIATVATAVPAALAGSGTLYMLGKQIGGLGDRPAQKRHSDLEQMTGLKMQNQAKSEQRRSDFDAAESAAETKKKQVEKLLQKEKELGRALIQNLRGA